MTLHIIDHAVLAEIERLARMTGLSEVAVVERAVERFALETPRISDVSATSALLTRLDSIPDRQDAFDPLSWDDRGLPD